MVWQTQKLFVKEHISRPLCGLFGSLLGRTVERLRTPANACEATHFPVISKCKVHPSGVHTSRVHFWFLSLTEGANA